MHYTNTTRITTEAFRAHTTAKKAILVHPTTPYRTLFLAHGLQAAHSIENVFYFRALAAHVTCYDFLRDFIESVAPDDRDFTHIRALLIDDAKAISPETIGSAFAIDLAHYRETQMLLIWDELDRIVDDAAFVPCIQALIAGLPDHVQIIFNSRRLHYEPWNALIAGGDVVVFGREYYQDAGMFSIEQGSKAQIEIVGFGRGHVRVNGTPITQWDGLLPRNLFFYFVDRPLVTRDEIFETFWPGLSVKEATNVFHVTKRKITERINASIRADGIYELTHYTRGYYLPSESVVRHSDVADFTAFIEQAAISDDEEAARDLYTRAVELYRAPFLQTVDMPWAENRRETLRTQWLGALVELTRIYQARSAYEQALGYTLWALRVAPEREDLHREAIHLYVQMNRFADAHAQFEHLEAIATKQRIIPSLETRAVYARLQTFND